MKCGTVPARHPPSQCGTPVLTCKGPTCVIVSWEVCCQFNFLLILLIHKCVNGLEHLGEKTLKSLMNRSLELGSHNPQTMVSRTYLGLD